MQKEKKLKTRIFFLIAGITSALSVSGIAYGRDGMVSQQENQLLDANGYPIEHQVSPEEKAKIQQDIVAQKKQHLEDKAKNTDWRPKCKAFMDALPKNQERLAKYEKERDDFMKNPDGSPRTLTFNETIQLNQMNFNIQKMRENLEKGKEFCDKILQGESSGKQPPSIQKSQDQGSGSACKSTQQINEEIDEVQKKQNEHMEAIGKTSGDERESHIQEAVKLGKEAADLDKQRTNPSSECAKGK